MLPSTLLSKKETLWQLPYAHCVQNSSIVLPFSFFSKRLSCNKEWRMKSITCFSLQGNRNYHSLGCILQLLRKVNRELKTQKSASTDQYLQRVPSPMLTIGVGGEVGERRFYSPIYLVSLSFYVLKIHTNASLCILQYFTIEFPVQFSSPYISNAISDHLA